jgi:glycosyl transferase family 25
VLDTGFEFFDAITPECSLEHVTGYNEAEFIVNCGRVATQAEIACYASHLALWRQCADEGIPYLILEDDAQLDDSFLTGLLVATSQINRLGFIRVSLPELSSSAVVRHLGPYDIHFCRRVPLLALGYAVSPTTAMRLSKRGGVVEEPVDKFLQRYWRHEQPVFAVVPPVVRLSDHASKSNIGHREIQRPNARTWIRRAARKSRNAIARTLYAARILSVPANSWHVSRMR